MIANTSSSMLRHMRAQARANMPDSITLHRDGTDLAPQPASVARPAGSVREGVFVQPPLGTVQVYMPHDADAQLGDEFAWGGYEWQVVEPPVLPTRGAALLISAEMRGAGIF